MHYALRRRLSLGVALMCFFLGGASIATAQSRLFPADDEQLWARFQKDICSLIENVPLVKRVPEITSVAATASAILGYFERDYPIFGPPVYGRGARMLNKFGDRAGRTPSAEERDKLSGLFHELEVEAFKTYAQNARAYPGESLGIARSRYLQKRGSQPMETLLAGVAKERRQVVRGQILGLSQVDFISSIDSKRLLILVLDGGKTTFSVVGYFQRGEFLIVIDPETAQPVMVPAYDVQLTDKDRIATDPWSQNAREILKGEKLVVDEVTSCKGRRPSGLRFLSPGRLDYKLTQVHVITEWGLDIAALEQLLKAP